MPEETTTNEEVKEALAAAPALPEPEAHSDDPASGRRRRRRRRTSSESEEPEVRVPQRAGWEIWAVTLLVLAVCFLGGGRSVLARALAMGLIGAVILLAPPTFRAPKSLLLTFLAVLLAPLLAYLPAHSLELDSSWRLGLKENWGISLPSSATAQPWVTFEAWLFHATGCIWVLWGLSRGTTEEDRRRLLRVLASGAVTLSVLTLLQERGMVHIPFWQFHRDVGNTYGPLVNRNHTSSLFAIGSVLCAACALDAYRRRSRQWIPFLLGIVPLFLAIIANTSRAGLLLFFSGLTVWLSTAAMRKGLFKKAAIIATIVAAGFALMSITGSKVFERLFEPADAGQVPWARDGRVGIYADSILMSSRSPWAGVGLGNFAERYPLTSTLKNSFARFAHPESDFIWLLTEGGALTLAPVLVGIILIFRRTGPWFSSRSSRSSDRQDRRLRNALAIGAGLGLLHGVVDVPLHGMALMITVGLLAGVCVRQSRVAEQPGLAHALAFRLGGAALIAASVPMFLIAGGRAALPGASSAALLSKRSLELSSLGRDADALESLNKAIEMKPLDWSLYFLRAQLHLRLNRSYSAALEDFGRARTLEPHYAKPFFEEGRIWLEYEPRLAVPAWREFLARNPVNKPDHYRAMLMDTARIRGMHEQLRTLATSADLQLVYLQQTTEDFKTTLEDMLASSSILEGLDPDARTRFFRLWQERGDRDALRAFLDKGVPYHVDGWQVLAEERARAGEFRSAYELAVRFIPMPTSPTTAGIENIAQLEKNFLFNQTDPRRGVDLYFAQKAKGQLNEALGTLEKISALPNAPAYLRYEMASIHALKQDHRTAWELLHAYYTGA